MSFPEFETQRLRLTMLTVDDASDLFTLFSDESVVKYYDLEAFNDVSQAENLIQFFNNRFNENSGMRWAIRLKDDDCFIGTCGFNSWSIKMKNAVIGYDLLPKCWGKGYVTEAVNEIVSAAFLDKLPCGTLNRIQADTGPGNAASESVLLKLGFKEEGLRRQSGYWKNQFHELKCYGLIKSDYIEN